MDILHPNCHNLNNSITMNKVKIFSSYNPDQLELECNAWLKLMSKNDQFEWSSTCVSCSHNGLFMIVISYWISPY